MKNLVQGYRQSRSNLVSPALNIPTLGLIIILIFPLLNHHHRGPPYMAKDTNKSNGIRGKAFRFNLNLVRVFVRVWALRLT
jgi:hypothetical protein